MSTVLFRGISRFLSSNSLAKSLGPHPRRSFVTSSWLAAIQSVKCPPFAESITEGDIHWDKAEGDLVSADEKVGSISTDKTELVVTAPTAGRIVKLLVADGDRVTAKQDIFQLDDAAAVRSAPQTVAAPPTAVSPEKSPSLDPHRPQPIAVIKEAVPGATAAAAAALASAAPAPVVRPATAAAAPSVDGSRAETREKLSRMRRRIATRLKDAQNTAAMLTTFNEIDMSGLVALRTRYQEAFQKKHGLKLGFMSAFCRGSAAALMAMPAVNAFIDESSPDIPEIVYRHYVDLSIAVATPRGLLVPVLRNVESMDFAQIEAGIHAMGERGRRNEISIEEMEGGTFTISNGGVFGSLFGTPIINPPQSAILGLHGIVQRPVVVSGTGKSAVIEARPMMYVALTYDHRLIDGREAVTFLRRIKSFVEDPASLFLDI